MRRSSRAPPAPWWAYALVFCAVLALFVFDVLVSWVKP